jgi:hypothetical protein
MILVTLEFLLIVTKVFNNNRMVDKIFSANIFYTNDACKLFILSLNNIFKVYLLLGFDYVYFLKKKNSTNLKGIMCSKTSRFVKYKPIITFL